MNNLIYQGIVEDVRNDKCSDREIEQLLEIFTKEGIGTLVKK